jgi:hypothetical protein
MADKWNRDMEYWWHDKSRTELTEDKWAHVLQSTRQIPNGLEWDRTRFSTLTAQELPDGASAQTPFLAAADEFYEEIIE